MKDRNLKVRSVAWVFDPASWQNDCFFVWHGNPKNQYIQQLGSEQLGFHGFNNFLWGQRVWQKRWSYHRPCHNSQRWQKSVSQQSRMEVWYHTWHHDATTWWHVEAGCKRDLFVDNHFYMFCFFSFWGMFPQRFGAWALPFYTTSKRQCACLKGSPAASHVLPHLGRAFTDVQEQKQVPGTQLFSQVFVLYILFPKKVFTTKAKKYWLSFGCYAKGCCRNKLHPAVPAILQLPFMPNDADGRHVWIRWLAGNGLSSGHVWDVNMCYKPNTQNLKWSGALFLHICLPITPNPFATWDMMTKGWFLKIIIIIISHYWSHPTS